MLKPKSTEPVNIDLAKNKNDLNLELINKQIDEFGLLVPDFLEEPISDNDDIGIDDIDYKDVNIGKQFEKNLPSTPLIEQTSLIFTNLPFSTTDDDLRTFLGKYKSISQCFVVKNKYQKSSQKATLSFLKNQKSPSKGFGFARFSDPMEAKQCLLDFIDNNKAAKTNDQEEEKDVKKAAKINKKRDNKNLLTLDNRIIYVERAIDKTKHSWSKHKLKSLNDINNGNQNNIYTNQIYSNSDKTSNQKIDDNTTTADIHSKKVSNLRHSSNNLQLQKSNEEKVLSSIYIYNTPQQTTHSALYNSLKRSLPLDINILSIHKHTNNSIEHAIETNVTNANDNSKNGIETDTKKVIKNNKVNTNNVKENEINKSNQVGWIVEFQSKQEAIKACSLLKNTVLKLKLDKEDIKANGNKENIEDETASKKCNEDLDSDISDDEDTDMELTNNKDTEQISKNVISKVDLKKNENTKKEKKKWKKILKINVSCELWALFKARETSKAGRLIIRNLSFYVDENLIRTTFEKIGPLSELNLPKNINHLSKTNINQNDSYKKLSSHRGFAFIQYKDFENAKKALQTLNNIKIKGRNIIIDWALDSRLYNKHALQDLSSTDLTSEINKSQPLFLNKKISDSPIKAIDKDIQKINSIKNDDLKTNLNIAKETSNNESLNISTNYDSSNINEEGKCQPKNNQEKSQKFKQKKDSQQSSNTSDELIFESISSLNDKNSSISTPDDSTLDQSLSKQLFPKSKDKKHKIDQAGDGNSSNKSRKLSSDVDEGKTILLRNLPFDTDEDELKSYLENLYGKSHYVRLVKSPQGLNTGIGFVKFTQLQFAQQLLNDEQLANQFNSQSQQEDNKQLDNKDKISFISNNAKKKKNYNTHTNSNIPFEGFGLQYNGRRIFAHIALPKEQAPKSNDFSSKLTSKQKQFEKKSQTKSLLMEGYIDPNSKEASILTKQELKKREALWKQKKVKLQNPNYFINNKRIILHNLPLTITANDIRKEMNKIFISNPILTTASPTSDKNSPISLASSKRPLEKAVKSVKVVRSDERTIKVGKSKNAEGRSKGFAFVEFDNSELALHILRQMNNNKYFGSPKRLIAEFAVEDSRALKLQRDKLQSYINKLEKQKQFVSKDQQNKTGKNNYSKNNVYDPSTQDKLIDKHKKRIRHKKYSRGKLQREKRRLKKMNQSQNQDALQYDNQNSRNVIKNNLSKSYKAKLLKQSKTKNINPQIKKKAYIHKFDKLFDLNTDKVFSGNIQKKRRQKSNIDQDESLEARTLRKKLQSMLNITSN